ncbi:hypothetical protein ACFY7H_01580 [Streptomyces sp. NPDC012794]|uniref:hypothetical protein n=1 Tax=Streptomyces sp. NPDC012794 TaxID=3364850 RepID=UPI00369A813B
MAARVALRRGAGLVIGVDLVPARLERARGGRHPAAAGPLGPARGEGFATHTMGLEEAPRADAMFQAREDGMIKTLLKP